MKTLLVGWGRFLVDRSSYHGKFITKDNAAELIGLEAPTKLQEKQSEMEAVHTLSSHMTRLSTKEDAIQQDNYISANDRHGPSNSILDEFTAGSSQTDNTAGDGGPDSLLGSSPRMFWMEEKGMIPVNQSEVMDNIEQWLDVDDDEDFTDEGVTSEEFDQFLAGRAKAAEHLPSVKPSPDDVSSQP